MAELDKTKTNPGFHRQFVLRKFTPEEQLILKRLSAEWYLTNSGTTLRLGNSEFRYFLMKPTEIFSEMFNIERELIVVFSPYPNFEPRSLDAFDLAQSQLSDLRVESVCRVLISQDTMVENKIDSLLKVDPEQAIVIPFSYKELTTETAAYFLRNRFRKHFYSRDLFAFHSPLKKDLYFFGRSALIQDLVNRHRSGEHTGLFGLRKSGKTSIIYAIERFMSSNGEQFISIDCESPSVHKLRWNELLHKIVLHISAVKDSKAKVHSLNDYTEKRAADLFAEDLLAIHRSKKSRPVLIILDEIERISPTTGSSDHWRDGVDFIYFWQTMRGFYQRHPEVFTYMLVGTNPNCVERPLIAGHENPLFSSLPSQYVPAFTLEQVEQMVSKLGRFMGLEFDKIIYAKLTEDFGGHPFLIRLVCSNISRECKGDRPVIVDKALYEKVRASFTRNTAEYLDMIVQVLREWYPNEYDMLTFLAQKDYDTFEQFASDHAQYTKHLVGYGLIQAGRNGYSFNIEAVKEFLESKHKFERLHLDDDEKVAEISSRRNRLERGLRGLIRNALKIAVGKKKAGEKALTAIPENRREKLSENIDVLLEPDSSPLFLLDIINIIKREWDSLEKVFDLEKTKLILMLEEINTIGRPDAHAKKLSEDDFAQLRLYFKKLEAVLDEWDI
jgi:AAA-like domain